MQKETNEIVLHDLQLQAIQDWKSNEILEICYDGGARSGKTHLICLAILQRALRFGGRHLISRLRGNHLEISVWRMTIIPLVEQYAGGNYEQDRVYRTIRFPHNGAEIIGLALDDPSRVEKIMGTEFSTCFVNEATQITFETYQAMKSRCVQSVPGLPNKVVIDCNPSTPHHWIHRYFLEKKNPKTLDEKLPTDVSKSIFRRGPWLPRENPFLSKQGVKVIESLVGREHTRLALGQWVAQEGLVYPDYMSAVVPAMQLKNDWDVTAAVDFGYSNPFAMLFVAIDYANETYWVFDEYYVREKTVYEHCAALREYRSQWCEGEMKVRWIVADHDAEDRATMSQCGMPTLAAKKDVRTGIQTVTNLMAAQNGWKLRIFETCTYLLSEMATYSWPDRRGDDRDEKPVKGDDHLLDSLRYWCMHLSSTGSVKYIGRVQAPY